MGGGYYDRALAFARHGHAFAKPRLTGVAFARQLYNDTATTYNVKQQQFPWNLIAGFARAEQVLTLAEELKQSACQEGECVPIERILESNRSRSIDAVLDPRAWSGSPAGRR